MRRMFDSEPPNECCQGDERKASNPKLTQRPEASLDEGHRENGGTASAMLPADQQQRGQAECDLALQNPSHRTAAAIEEH